LVHWVSEKCDLSLVVRDAVERAWGRQAGLTQ